MALRARHLLVRFLLMLPLWIAAASWAAHMPLHGDALEHHPQSPVYSNSLAADVPAPPAPVAEAKPATIVVLEAHPPADPLPEEPARTIWAGRGPPRA